jgi:hypothetical protein
MVIDVSFIASECLRRLHADRGRSSHIFNRAATGEYRPVGDVEAGFIPYETTITFGQRLLVPLLSEVLTMVLGCIAAQSNQQRQLRI